MGQAGIFDFVVAVEKPDRVRVGGIMIKAVEARNRREVDRGLPCVRGRDRLRGVRFPENHPRAPLFDQALSEIAELKKQSRSDGISPVISSAAVENSAPVIPPM